MRAELVDRVAAVIKRDDGLVKNIRSRIVANGETPEFLIDAELKKLIKQIATSVARMTGKSGWNYFYENDADIIEVARAFVMRPGDLHSRVTASDAGGRIARYAY